MSHYKSGTRQDAAFRAGGSASVGAMTQLGTVLRFGVVGDLSDGLARATVSDRARRGRPGGLLGAGGAAWSDGAERLPAGSRQSARLPRTPSRPRSWSWPERPARCRTPSRWPGWLHGIALRIAMRAKADEARRRVHERRCAALKEKNATARPSDPSPVRSSMKRSPALPRRYREPVVLCYLEGLTSEQAAMRIGCPRGTSGPGCRAAAAVTQEPRPQGRGVARGVACRGRLDADRSAALPATLVNATVRASQGFAGRRATEAALGFRPGGHTRKQGCSRHDDLQAGIPRRRCPGLCPGTGRCADLDLGAIRRLEHARPEPARPVTTTATPI